MYPTTQIRNSGNIVCKIAFCTALVATFLILIPLRPGMPVSGLDPSWAYALNAALADHLTFGRDLIFTFGPLGSVYTRLYHPATDTVMLIGSIVFAAGFCSGYMLLILRGRLYWALPLPFAIAVIQSSDAVFMALPLFLLLASFRLANINEQLEDYLPSRAAWCLTAILSVSIGILPLIKGSFSGMAGFLGTLSILLLIRAKKKTLAISIVAFSLAAIWIGWILTKQPIAALPRFFIAQMPIISGYTDAMSDHGPFEQIAYWGIATLVVLFIFIFYISRNRKLDGLIVATGIAIYVFITFKAGFVRQDAHPKIAIGALVLLALSIAPLVRASVNLLLTLVIVIFCWSKVERQIDNIHPRTLTERIEGAAQQVIDGIRLRTSRPGVLEEEFSRANANIRAEFPLPPITGTVDTYPTELTPIYAYGLKWAGRPIPQSYSAYTSELDHINAQHLTGASAPETVLFSISPIDGRMPTLEDAGSWPILITNYYPVNRTQNFLLLKRNSRLTNPQYSKLNVTRTKLNQPVILPKTYGPIIASIKIKKTLLGKALTAAFRLPRMYIRLKLEDGRVITNRFVPSMASTGFIISPYISSQDDLLLLYSGVNVGRVESAEIIAPKIGAWKHNIAISFTTFTLPPQPGARIIAFAKPGAQPVHVDAKMKAECYIDSLNNRPGVIGTKALYINEEALSIKGWAFPLLQKAYGPDSIWISLTDSEGHSTFYQANLKARPDVRAAFNYLNTNLLGFSVNIDVSHQKGNRSLSIYTLHEGMLQSCKKQIAIQLQ